MQKINSNVTEKIYWKRITDSFIQGNIRRDFEFKNWDQLSVTDGCGTTFMGQFWYFGDGKQVSLIRLIGCSYDSSKTTT